MELIERYLQAVRFWMPKAQQDLVAELGTICVRRSTRRKRKLAVR